MSELLDDLVDHALEVVDQTDTVFVLGRRGAWTDLRGDLRERLAEVLKVHDLEEELPVCACCGAMPASRPPGSHAYLCRQCLPKATFEAIPELDEEPESTERSTVDEIAEDLGWVDAMAILLSPCGDLETDYGHDPVHMAALRVVQSRADFVRRRKIPAKLIQRAVAR